jgi:hypothetical protein
MRVKIFLIALLVLSIATAVAAQESTNGRGGSFKDPLLENLVGDWKIKRSIRGQVFESKATARWVLNHQFLVIDMTDGKTPSDYAATIYIGFDDERKSYVVHWIDTFGGRFSETLGYGKREGNTIPFIFEYPDGPFRNTFTWDEKKRSWSLLMQSRGKDGSWQLFAEDTLTR